MGNIIFHVFITILAVIGFIETSHRLISLLYKSKDTKSILLVFPNSDNPEISLRNCVSELKWSCSLRPNKIYCIDNNLSEESKEICRIFCREYDFLEIISIDELQKIIN